ncbi:Lrp/AsnC family transcriptional regulator [Gallaecimonas kandeliae]|uniref:Lrp/AsnC family transcriptional regulator n=1 Tax=Gallaecimonas kandeliae TaxID=3029055 RepID=UPI00264876CB|nr:Lrp/AsnC family transcriptional regulator [Gallaecimonas kandeliae]WKE65709.1 Lrp/AsnC family transcriptional regulator [Gallaecimonas kandeliae]
MDKFDQQIIALLRKDARMAVTQIAREVSLSRSAVSERIQQLESQGIILGYHAQVAAPGQPTVKAYLELFYKEHRCEDYVALMRAHPEIKRCRAISGETDMLVYVEAATMERLIEVRAVIEQYPKMQRVKTHMVMKEWEF